MNRRVPYNQFLDIYLPPFPSESITSWIVRLARANAIGLHEFGSRVYGVTAHSTTASDLDVLKNKQFLLGLCRVTGRRLEEIELASLATWEWLLSAESPGRRWLLAPSRVPGGARQGQWTHACFSCLAQDDKPFFRVYWRFAFVTECMVHHAPLHDVCPRCSGSLDYPRMDRGSILAKRLLPLSVCPHCSVDWRIYGQRTQTSNPMLYAMQRRLLKGLSTRWVTEKNGMVLASLALDGVHRLAKCFRTEVGSRVAARLIGEPVHAQSGEQIEKLSVKARRPLLAAVASSLADWPESFTDAAYREGLTVTHLRERGPAPWWIEQAISGRIDRTWYAPSPVEAANAKETLSRYGIKAAPWVLREWLGCHVPVRRLGLVPQHYAEPLQLQLWQNPSEVRDAIRSTLLSKMVKVLRRYCSKGRKRGSEQKQLVLELATSCRVVIDDL